LVINEESIRKLVALGNEIEKLQKKLREKQKREKDFLQILNDTIERAHPALNLKFLDWFMGEFKLEDLSLTVLICIFDSFSKKKLDEKYEKYISDVSKQIAVKMVYLWH